MQHPEGASDDEIIAYAKKNSVPVGQDIAQSVAAAPRKVAEGMLGLPGLAAQGLNKGIDYLLGTQTPTSSRVLPTAEDIQAQTSKVLGPSYQAQTTPGKYAGAATEGVVGQCFQVAGHHC